MNPLQKAFEYDQQQIRTIVQNNEIWFVAKDVCDVLELSNVTVALSRLDEDERSKLNLGRQGETNLVNESGLYELIFNSRKQSARDFKKWVKSEVLPAIRKTGQYNVEILDERRQRIEAMKLTIETAERQDEMQQVLNTHQVKINELETKVEEQITLTSGEQRRLQKAVATKVYELCDDPAERPSLFREIYREIKDRFAVASYKDVKQKELQSAIRYIENWIPRKVS